MTRQHFIASILGILCFWRKKEVDGQTTPINYEAIPFPKDVYMDGVILESDVNGRWVWRPGSDLVKYYRWGNK